MTRALTTAAANAAQGEVVMCVRAVDLDFASGHVRVNGSPVSIWIDGAEFLGVGALGAISTIEETADLQSSGISLQLAGIPRDAVSLAVTEDYQGRAATVWEVLLDRDTQAVIADPVVVFKGRMDQLTVELGSTATVEVTVEDRATDMDRANLARYTDEDQQRAYSGDRGFEFVAETVEKEIVWPARSFTG